MSQGVITSSLRLDVTAIGALKKYIAWCDAKRKRLTTLSLHAFNNDGNELRDTISKLEHALFEQRKQRSVALSLLSKRDI